SDAFTPVPRPRAQAAASTPAAQEQPKVTALGRWLEESVDDEPFNTIGAVKFRKDSPASSPSKASSSVQYLAPLAPLTIIPGGKKPSSFESSTFDWTFSLPPQNVHPATLAEAGLKCETKRFDSFYNDNGDRIVLPAGKKYSSDKTKTSKSALIITTYWDKHQDLEKTVLDIKSPYMKAALKAIVPEYNSINIDLRHIAIRNKPWCLFHYRQELLDHGAILQEQGNLDAAQHVSHLLFHMWEVFMLEINAFSLYELSRDDDPSIEYEYLWMVFRSGDTVYVPGPTPRAFRFEYMQNFGTSWSLRGHCIDYDGESFGFRRATTSISFYHGVKPLRKLEAINFNDLAAGERQSINDRLIDLGRRFVGIHGQRYLQYDGNARKTKSRTMWHSTTTLHRPSCPANIAQAKTRMMADYEGYETYGPGSKSVLEGSEKKFKAANALHEMTEADFMLCSTRVAGYSLRENAWKEFGIDQIGNITFNSQAFESLILPSAQKQQLLSLVHAHEDNDTSFDDLIEGKGRGLVVLLYGETGVGKTLTAESLAEYYQKPLVRLDAGILGTSAGSVERGLKDAFRLAERWHALLLLDEADVYLEQRRSRNLVHNGIIKNLVRTACALANSDKDLGGRISQSHLEMALQPVKQFARAMAEVNRHEESADELAGEDLLNPESTSSELGDEDIQGGDMSEEDDEQYDEQDDDTDEELRCPAKRQRLS
ncbi:hypothetical protein CC79DRAFT_1271386, partial [Sarocladium strictum]